VSKKKRERGREYKGKKRKREYYDKYRITMGRKENTNTMMSIWLQQVEHISLCALFGNVSINFIPCILWQRCNVSKLHSWYHRETCRINTSNVIKENLLLHLEIVIYRRLHFLSLVETISYAFLKKFGGGDET